MQNINFLFEEENNNEKIIYMEKNKTIIGTIRFNIKNCELCNIKIISEYQRKGYGTLLFNEMLKKMNMCQTISWRAIYSSVGFYKSLGASITTNDYLDSSDKTIHMHINTKKIKCILQFKIVKISKRIKAIINIYHNM